MKIPVVIEPDYHHSIWCERTVLGINAEIGKKKYDLLLIDGDAYQSFDYETLFAGAERLLIVIGTSVSWIPRALAFFESSKIQVILVSYQPPEYTQLRGVVRMDYVSAMHKLITYLKACRRPRIALYGFNPNSSADRIKQRYFCSLAQKEGDDAPDSHVYHNYASLAQCYDGFRPYVSQYDAVICANDIVAVSLVKRLQRSGIRVPEALFVTCFGDSMLSQFVSPGITTASLDHVEMGRQAVALYSHLYRQPEAVSSSIRVESRLLVRRSTMEMPPPNDYAILTSASEPTDAVDFYSDEEVKRLCVIDSLISSCDELDRDILSGILAGKTYEAMAEMLSTTTSTLRYRLRRMLGAAGLDSREALAKLFQQYIPGFPQNSDG